MNNRFTLQIRGNVDAESKEKLQDEMRQVLATFPQFKMTFSSIEVWQDGDGNPRVFNDDGTEYFPPSDNQATDQPEETEEDEALETPEMMPTDNVSESSESVVRAESK